MIAYFRRRTARAFDKWAPYYAEDARNKLLRRGYSYGQLGQLIADYIGRDGGEVFEIGTGPGTLGPSVREQLRSGGLVGFDISPKMAEAAGSTGAYEIIFRGNAERLPFREGSFRAMFTAFVFHSILNRDLAIDEIWRVLRPGGRAVIVDLFPERRSSAVAAVAGFFHSLRREHGAPAKYLPVGSLVTKLQKRGFKVSEVKPLGAKKLYAHFAIFAQKPDLEHECNHLDL